MENASAIAFVLIIAYTAGADLSLSSRFQFFYFPAVFDLPDFKRSGPLKRSRGQVRRRLSGLYWKAKVDEESPFC